MSHCEHISILLVDEDVIFRQALADNLRIDGHLVVECVSAEQAIPTMSEEPYGAMIAEYTLAGFNGVLLADEFRKACAGPTVLVTAQFGGPTSFHVGVRHYVELLPKPVAYDRVHDTVHHLVTVGRDS